MCSYVEVLDINIWVLWEVVVLLGHKNTLLEEVLVDRFAIGLGNKPALVSFLATTSTTNVHTLSRVPVVLRGIVYNASVLNMLFCFEEKISIFLMFQGKNYRVRYLIRLSVVAKIRLCGWIFGFELQARRRIATTITDNYDN